MLNLAIALGGGALPFDQPHAINPASRSDFPGFHCLRSSDRREDAVDEFLDLGLAVHRFAGFGFFEREQAFFLKAIREDLDLGDQMDDAVKSLKIVLAADESIRTKRAVDL